MESLSSTTLALALAAPLAVTSPETAALGPGQPIERKLAAGEAHAYLVEAGPGELLRITVDQRGADVIARLYGPSGALLQEADAPGFADGIERLSAWAQAAGSFRLELRPRNERAGGRYRADVRRLRLATSEAAPWLEAELAFAEASRTGAGRGGASRRRSLELYEQALAAWRALGDRRAEAETLVAVAAVGGFREEPRRKLRHALAARDLWRALGHAYREAQALSEIASLYRVLGATNAERDHCEEALARWRELGDVRGEAQALIALGAYHHGVGDARLGSELVGEGSDLARELGDRRLEAEATYWLAGIRWSLGEIASAAELMEASRAAWHSLGDRYREAQALSNLAAGYRELGREEDALRTLRRVLTMAREEGHAHLTALNLTNLGTYYRDHSRWEQARECYLEALALFRRQGQRWDEGQVVRRLGDLEATQGRFDEAAARYLEAVHLNRETETPKGESEALYALARLERRRGRLDDARTHVQAALDIVEGLRASVTRLDWRASYLASVLRQYELAIGLAVDLDRRRPGEGHAAEALHLAERARARSFLESLGEAQADIRQGAHPHLQERRRRVTHALRDKAMELQESRRAGGRPPSEVAAELDRLLDQLHQVEASIRRASPRYAELVLPQPLRLADIQRQIPDDDTLVLEYALGEERSHLFLVARHRLDVVDLPGRKEVEGLAREVHRLFQRGRFETAAESRARRRQAGDGFPRTAAALSDAVLGPAAPLLRHKRLAIVADGALHYVPFAALPLPPGHPAAAAPGRAPAPLVAAHEIVHLPSASVLAVTRTPDRTRRGTVAVVADAVYEAADPRVAGRTAAAPVPPELARSLRDFDRASPGEPLPRLPFTRREAEAILALVPKAHRRAALDFDASRETVESGVLDGHAVVHFATHSLVNGVHPELSGLVLSLVDRAGRPRDGFLRAHEIFNLELAADLAVLSGCSTGLGRETRGEGIVGLARAFLYAGAQQVLVSLWDVQDEATAAFMERFYRALLGRGLPPPAALREAQLSFVRDRRWSSPYYWAPFVVQGDWRGEALPDP